MKSKIRPATALDKPEIVELYKYSQAATGIPNPRVHPPESLEELLYSRPIIEQFVTVEDGLIISHGIVEGIEEPDLWRQYLPQDIKPSDTLQVGGLFTHPERMREGLGSEMLDNCLGRIRKLGKLPVLTTFVENHHVSGMSVKRQAEELATVTLSTSLDAKLYLFH